MKRCLAAIIFVLVVGNGLLWAKGPEVGLIDNKLSVSADSVSLGRLLQLIDLATGMKSKVPPELANRNISVRFSGLNINDGVRKLFQGQPLDYVVIDGQGIVVTAASQNVAGGADPVPVYNTPQQAAEQPFIQDFPPQPLQQGIQPATIPTPFGPLANPNVRAQPQQPNPTMTFPGQQNSLFPQPAQQNQPLGQPAGQPIGQPAFPGAQPNPFGTPSPFGTPTPANQNPNQNNIFAPAFGTPGTPQR
jgi:hypothetical protein